RPVGNGFKFPVSTPEGQEERREHERKRKEAARAVARQIARQSPPPPLPSAGAGTGNPGTAQPVGQSGGVGTAIVPPPIPWEAKNISGLLTKLITAAEESRVASFVAKCEKAGLMPDLIKEIEADAHLPKLAKELLCDALPRLAAKYLNAAGIPAHYQDEVAVISALILILQHDRSVTRRLDELIALKKKEMTAHPSPAPQPAMTV
ncbi:MAG TPA: hypothetical protein PKA41_18075, partial [Verrucomicrobiota bacterium]|nr:hypothetical protein [Verrucomicrobiota bacterium]